MPVRVSTPMTIDLSDDEVVVLSRIEGCEKKKFTIA
jgi:hypothetical protein